MDGTDGLAFRGVNPMNVQKKRRSFTSRRPRSDLIFFHNSHELLPSSSVLAPEGEAIDKAESDDNWAVDSRHKQKELISINGMDTENTPRRSSSDYSKSRQTGERLGEFSEIPMSVSDKYYSRNNASQSSSEFERSSEGVLAPANWKSSSSQKPNRFQTTDSGSKWLKVGSGESERNGRRNSSLGSGKVSHSSQENKLRKVKLKVGGVTHTIHTKPTPNSGRPPRSSDVPGQGQKPRLQENSNDESRSPPDSGFQGPVRKSNRVPKRRVLDGDFDNNDDGDNDELRYLDRLKSSKSNAGYGMESDDGYQVKGNPKQINSRDSKKPGGSKLYKDTTYEGGTPFCKEKRKKGRSRDADDVTPLVGGQPTVSPTGVSYNGNQEATDHLANQMWVVTDEPYSADEDESGYADEDDETVSFSSGSRRKKPKTVSVQSPADDKEIPLTTRQRALQSAKDPSSGLGLVEFPDGLPLPAPKKQKDKLTDVEQQLKKAEAAQRRRMQVEKAARESEAQAIRKILGQDANGKKKDDKLRKRKEEIAQAKAARAMTIPSNSVRWTMGPSGTVVTFPKDVDLPSIFSSPPCSYPPPREKCAGPSCTNAYKYRDSKSNLPLCSLQCYKAVNQMREPAASC